MATYRPRICSVCGATFTPKASVQTLCSATCRFHKVAEMFSDTELCWEWPLSRQPSGYGQMTVTPRPNQTVVTAHRMSYEVFTGAIPIGMCVMHTCDNRGCFNPAHLQLGTLAQNNHDMIAKGRAAWQIEGGALAKAKKAWITRRARYGQTTSNNRTPAQKE